MQSKLEDFKWMTACIVRLHNILFGLRDTGTAKITEITKVNYVFFLSIFINHRSSRSIFCRCLDKNMALV